MKEVEIKFVFTGIDLKLARKIFGIFRDMLIAFGGEVGGYCGPYVDEEGDDGEGES